MIDRVTIKALQDRQGKLKTEREAHVAAVAKIDRELEELATAERVLTTFNVPMTLFNSSNDDAGTPSPANSRPLAKPTLPEMVIEVVAQGHGGNPNTVMEEIENRWKFKPDPNHVRPTLWRLAKDGRLRKVGAGYVVP